MLADPTVHIAARQRAWARRNGRGLVGSKGDRGVPAYTDTLDGNLFEPLSPEARADYLRGDGGELGRTAKEPGKMQAVHSSSALCCNVFHYWRRIGRADVLARACGLSKSGLAGVSFEQQLPIDRSQFRYAPNLDAVFRYKHHIVGLESKFCEPFSTRGHPGLKPAYLMPSCDEFWQPFPALRKLAETISPGNHIYARCDVAQLLKHVLGLSRESPGHVQLVYLYYAVPGVAGEEHAREIQEFAGVARKDGVAVMAVSYQDFILSLLRRDTVLSPADRVAHGRYLDYVTDRYL